jgi:hypothetical protein
MYVDNAVLGYETEYGVSRYGLTAIRQVVFVLNGFFGKPVCRF